MAFGDPLTVDVEEAIEAAGAHSRSDGSLHIGTVDFDGNSSFLKSLGSLLGSLSFHLPDGERGHGDYCGGGVAPGLHYCNPCGGRLATPPKGQPPLSPRQDQIPLYSSSIAFLATLSGTLLQTVEVS